MGSSASRHVRRIASAAVVCSAVCAAASAQEGPAAYAEKYRPQFHFSPKSGWIGDPDGLIRRRGTYHLYWWGHAESKDLVHWDEKPYPMHGDDGSFTYFTGSVVDDAANTSGLGRGGEGPLVAVYTADDHVTKLQTQCLSISHDGGETFHYHPGNPVLDVGSRAFRDPDVFWHEPTGRWVMAITLPEERKVRFYASKDLKAWESLSDFGPVGGREQLWEVPNLLRLPLDGDAAKTKWVLVCGMGPNKAQFFVGDFDGTRFRLDPGQEAFLAAGVGLPGDLFADFEGGGYAGWVADGDAFGSGPDAGGLPLAGYLGKGLVSTRRAGGEATGTLTSPPFRVTRNCMNFLIGGGDHPGETGVELVVGGKVARTATGRNSDVLAWSGWDVREFRGKEARLRVVDKHKGDWANVTLDHVLFSDVLFDHGREQAAWVDWGPDFYAVRAWRSADGPQDRTVWLGWMGNWEYAREVPTSWGKGAESVPREVELVSGGPGGYRLRQRPVPELAVLRREPWRDGPRPLAGGAEPLGFRPTRNCYEVEAVFGWDGPDADVGLELCVGGGHRTTVGFDVGTSTVYLDRRRSGEAEFHPAFPRRVTAPHVPAGGEVRLRVLVDQSSVEVFVGGGETALTSLIFPEPGDTGVAAFSRGGPASLRRLEAWELESIWEGADVTGDRPGPTRRKPGRGSRE